MSPMRHRRSNIGVSGKGIRKNRITGKTVSGKSYSRNNGTAIINTKRSHRGHGLNTKHHRALKRKHRYSKSWHTNNNTNNNNNRNAYKRRLQSIAPIPHKHPYKHTYNNAQTRTIQTNYQRLRHNSNTPLIHA
eukprot:883713_1